MPALRTSLMRALRVTDLTPDAVVLSAAAAGDADAVKTLMFRHGPMVLRVCRNVLGDAHAAEDVFQAVFLVLIRRGWRLDCPDRLAAWLFGTARRLAHKLNLAAARRRRRENRPTLLAQASPLDHITAREMLVALDDEIERLPETLRLPLLLCYWQGLTQDEAARRLRCSAGSIKGRLERGRRQLATRLMKRGFTPSAILTASLVSAAVPGELFARTVALAIPAAAVPASVLALAASGSTLISVWKGAAAFTVLSAAIAGIGWTGHIAPAGPASVTTFPEAQAAQVPHLNNRLAKRALRDAEQVLEKVHDDAMERAELWCHISQLHVKFDDLASARLALGKAKAVWITLELRQKSDCVGRGYAALGNVNEVVALAKMQRPVPPPEGWSEGGLLQYPCLYAVHAGQTKAALQIADAMANAESHWFRSYALRRALLDQAKPGKLAAAVQAIDELPKDEYKAYALVGTVNFQENDTGIAPAQFEAGDLDGARRSIREALAIGARLQNPQSERIIAAAIRAMARMNDLQAVEQESARLTVPQLQLMAAIEIAKAHIRAGKESSAIALVEKFKDGEDRAQLHYEVGFEFDHAGNKTKAGASFRQAEALLPITNYKRIYFLSKIAKSGNYKLAIECVAEAEKSSMREAETFVGESLRKMVMDRMNTVVDYHWLTVATEQAKKGDFSSAMETATQRFKTRSRRGECLSEIAKEQTRAGQEGDVRSWIAREEDLLFRAYALFGLANGHYREADRHPKPASK